MDITYRDIHDGYYRYYGVSSKWNEVDLSYSTLQTVTVAPSNFFFLIRNEEDYINKRTNTEEKKETKEREKKTPREGWEVLPTQ